jgi:hypothetical protein
LQLESILGGKGPPVTPGIITTAKAIFAIEQR